MNKMSKNIYTVLHFKAKINGENKVFYHISDAFREYTDLISAVKGWEEERVKPYKCELFLTKEKAVERIEELKQELKNKNELYNGNIIDWIGDVFENLPRKTKKGFHTIRIWVGNSNSSVEIAGLKGRMNFSLSRQSSSDLYDFLQNIDFKYIELYHHKVLKSEADWEDEEQRNEFNKYLCSFFNL